MADIPVNASDRVIIVTATSDGQTDFDFDFLAFVVDQISATHIRLSDGFETPLSATTDFTATGLSNPLGGTITLLSTTIVTGDKVVIYGSTTIQRLADYQQSGDFLAATVNTEQDMGIMMMQEQQRDIDRSVKVGFGYPAVGDFPTFDPGKALIWHDTDNKIINGPDANDIASAEDYAEQAKALSPFASRLEIEAAQIPVAVFSIAYVNKNGVYLQYVRDPSGTALTTSDGATWSPAGQAYITHWGAIAEDSTAPVKIANGLAIKAALAFSRHVIVPTNGRVFATLAEPLKFKSGQVLMGVGMPTAADDGVDDGGAKLILDDDGVTMGAEFAALESDDKTVAMNQCAISNLAIQFAGTFTRMADFPNMIGCELAYLDFSTDSAAMHGLRANKTTAISWRNDFTSVRIRVPTGGNGIPWDVSFGDSNIIGLTLGGGAGSFDRSTGNNNYIGGMWNNSSVAAMRFTGRQGIGLNGKISSVVVEENTGLDIVIDADNNTDASSLSYLSIAGCTFRSNAGNAAITLINATGTIRRGIAITGNVFSGNAAKAIDYDQSRWAGLIITGNSYRKDDMNILSYGEETVGAHLINAAGEITIYNSRATVATAGAAIADDLVTINGGMDGSILVLQTITDGTRVVTCKDGVGNMLLDGDCILTNQKDRLSLMYDRGLGKWVEIGRSIK